MWVYLPIAEIPVNAFLVLGMGAAVGYLSGMFGVGGGFLLTPLLIFYGVPSSVAVATSANPLVATSIAGTVAQYRRKNVDLKLGLYLLAGGAVGSFAGVLIIGWLKRLGQVDLIVSVLYVVMMGTVGMLMLAESVRAWRRQRHTPTTSMRRPSQHTWLHGLPFKTRFKVSKLYISTVPALGLGAAIGLLSGVMGVGGGFVMVPILIYVLRVPTNIAIGTSLFQVIFVSALSTVFHASLNQTVDILLALLLMIGGVFGARAGAAAGQKLKAEQLRFLLALLVLAVGVRLGVDLLAPPKNPFSVVTETVS
jgi:uncharacterized membrane protein YfcA